MKQFNNHACAACIVAEMHWDWPLLGKLVLL
jgi:hypothetical protein